MKAVVALTVVVLSCYLNNVQAQDISQANALQAGLGFVECNLACSSNGDCNCDAVTTKTCQGVCNANSCSGSGSDRPDGALCNNGGQCMNPPCKVPSALFCNGNGNCGTC